MYISYICDGIGFSIIFYYYLASLRLLDILDKICKYIHISDIFYIALEYKYYSYAMRPVEKIG